MPIHASLIPLIPLFYNSQLEWGEVEGRRFCIHAISPRRIPLPILNRVSSARELKPRDFPASHKLPVKKLKSNSCSPLFLADINNDANLCPSKCSISSQCKSSVGFQTLKMSQIHIWLLRTRILHLDI